MRSAAVFLVLACALGLVLALGITSSPLLPGPPVVWFVGELVLFAGAGMLLAIAGIKFFDALAERQAGR